MASSINADNGVSSGSAGLKSTADSSGVLALQTNGTTAISIDASQAVSFTNQPTYSGGTANGVAYLNGSKVLTTGSALVFDGTNLGVGVTPSAWSWKALQIGSFGGFFATNTGAYASYLGNNAYYNAGWKYIASTAAVHYEMAGGDGAHRWYNAPSGTAGNAITFTQAMTLDASGNLGIGTTSPAYKLDVVSTSMRIASGSTGVGYVQYGNSSTASNNWHVGTEGDGTYRFYNGNFGSGTERARIDSSGNLIQTGVTTASGMLMSALGSSSSNSTTNSATYNITIVGSAKVFWVYTANGDGCLVVTNYTTSTITIVGTGGVIVASASPASNQLGISKSINSHVVTFKTGSAASTTWSSWGIGSLSSTVA